MDTGQFAVMSAISEETLSNMDEVYVYTASLNYGDLYRVEDSSKMESIIDLYSFTLEFSLPSI